MGHDRGRRPGGSLHQNVTAHQNVGGMRMWNQLGKPDSTPWPPPGLIHRRTVTLRVDVELPGNRRVGVLEIIGSDARLTDLEASKVQRMRVQDYTERQYWPVDPDRIEFYGSSSQAFETFTELTASVERDEDLREYLPQLLRSSEALVPHFNSPPSEWSPLRIVAEQASAIGLGVTWGTGSTPALVGAYIGGLFLVKFLTPVVAEAGNATAAGVSAKIRTAFGVNDPNSLPGPRTFGEAANSPDEAASREESGPDVGDGSDSRE